MSDAKRLATIAERLARLERVVRAVVRAQRWREWAVAITLAPRHPLARPGIEAAGAEERQAAEDILLAIDALWPPEFSGPAPAAPLGSPA